MAAQQNALLKLIGRVLLESFKKTTGHGQLNRRVFQHLVELLIVGDHLGWRFVGVLRMRLRETRILVFETFYFELGVQYVAKKHVVTRVEVQILRDLHRGENVIAGNHVRIDVD